MCSMWYDYGTGADGQRSSSLCITAVPTSPLLAQQINFTMMNPDPNDSQIPNHAEDFGKVPNPSEVFGNLPQASAPFGTVPHDSETFRNPRTTTVRNENHTLTVREAARLFEGAGVARTERSIINWCQSNPQGLARLEAYFDMSERKWFITPESVERAIAEEKAKAAKHGEPLPSPSESRREPPASERAEQLEKEVLDLKILNGGKIS